MNANGDIIKNAQQLFWGFLGAWGKKFWVAPRSNPGVSFSECSPFVETQQSLDDRRTLVFV